MPIILKPLNANLSHDTETFGSMSPYCIFRLGNQQHRTQVCHDGGKQPFWNDTIFFNSATDCLLRVQVWDEDAVSDDLVGEGQMDIRQVNNGRDEESIDLFYKGRPAGRIMVQLDLQNMGGMGGPMMGGGMGGPMMGGGMGGPPMGGGGWGGNSGWGGPMGGGGMGGPPMGGGGWGGNSNWGPNQGGWGGNSGWGGPGGF